MRKETNINRYKIIIANVCITIISAMLSAFTLHIFVYGNSFAPSGVDGLATMLQQITGKSAGFFYFAFNIPLIIAAYFFLDKKYVVYTLFFIVLSSVFQIILQSISFYQYITEGERFLVAVISGFLLGIRTGLALKIDASTGGVDIIACIIHKKSRYINVERIIAIISYVTIFLSFFVYKDITCILLSFAQMYIFEKGVDLVLRDNRNAVEFKIITKSPTEILNEIMFNLKHGATKIESIGAYTESGSTMIITIINRRQIPHFLKIIKRYPDTFVYFNSVSGVNGNFRWKPTDEVK